MIDHLGRQLGDREFPASPVGYRALVEWLQGHGGVDRVGVEGTGTYGAGLARHLREAGMLILGALDPMTKSTTLSTGPINGAEVITVELIQPDSMPAVVRIVWPTALTITTPARDLEVASTAMRLLAEASTTLARIRASRRL